MREQKHKTVDNLEAGEYLRLSPAKLGALIRKGRCEAVPSPGHERRIPRTGQSDCWVTWFAGAYEVRCYSHGINTLPVEFGGAS